MEKVIEEVRLLTAVDAPEYAALRRAMLADSPLAFSASPGTDYWSEALVVDERLRRPEYAIVGGFRGGRLAGAAGMVRDLRPKMAHLVTVWGVWVEPSARGVGLGEAVMRKVVEIARGWSGVRALGLSAGAGQAAARRLYERVGFVAWGVEPGVLMYEGVMHDEVHMQLRL